MTLDPNPLNWTKKQRDQAETVAPKVGAMALLRYGTAVFVTEDSAGQWDARGLHQDFGTSDVIANFHLVPDRPGMVIVEEAEGDLTRRGWEFPGIGNYRAKIFAYPIPKPPPPTPEEQLKIARRWIESLKERGFKGAHQVLAEIDGGV